MKVRNGFVSNSSSSSFIIQRSAVTEDQINLIKNYHAESIRLVKEGKARWYTDRNTVIPEGMTEDEYEDLPCFGYEDNDWWVEEYDSTVICKCVIDNFSMGSYLRYIGIESGCEEGDW